MNNHDEEPSVQLQESYAKLKSSKTTKQDFPITTPIQAGAETILQDKL